MADVLQFKNNMKKTIAKAQRNGYNRKEANMVIEQLAKYMLEVAYKVE